MQLTNCIVLPDGLDDVSGFGEVVTRLNVPSLGIDDVVDIDLANVSFISPYGLVGLLLLGKEIYQRTSRKSRLIDNNEDKLKYLERMDFFKMGELWFHDPQVSQKHARNSRTRRLFEIHKISVSKGKGKFDVDEIVSEFRDRASLILDSFQEKMNVSSFIGVMGELCTNVYTHSKSDGYIAIQRYDYPRHGFEVVKLSVMDDGIGIRSSLEAMYKFKYQKESDYLLKALEPQISGAGDRGFGLAAVKSNVEKAAGYLWINSGSSAILLEPGSKRIKEYINIPYLRGTRIAIILTFNKLNFMLDRDG